MTLYHRGEALAGPCFEVCLLRNLLFGVSWTFRIRPLQYSRYFGIFLGPLVLMWWWPYKKASTL